MSTTKVAIDDDVMNYWLTTRRRTKDTRISHLLRCECCGVIFPSGDSADTRRKKNGRCLVLCALCRPQHSAGKPCRLHP